MTLKHLLTPATVAAMLALGSLPASADTRDHNEHARARSEAARPQVQPRSDQGRSDNRAAVPRNDARVAPRAAEPVRPSIDNRRVEDNRRFEDNRRVEERRAVPRTYASPRVYTSPRYYSAPRYYASPRIFVPRAYHPGLSFSFGVFFGRPYPYRWAYPVYVPVPYGYPAYTIPAGVPYGGISFAGLTPYDSSVFVDGTYVGVASTFDGTRQPLTLTAGRHRIELQAPGYEPIAFDVDVPPGQVIPYQGGLPQGYGY